MGLALLALSTSGVFAQRGEFPSRGPKTVQAAQPSTVVPPNILILPEPLPDPLEPMNRVIWGFNKGVMGGVIKPTAEVYRSVVAKPARTGIANFGRNIAYPVRLVNNLLQGRWAGARQETDRFFVNTIAGGAGFMDVATRWHMPKSEADFGQTFGKWGWQPGCYLMLPILGPSNERDAVGFVGDTAGNPLTYVSPYSFEAENPLTYMSPYSYATMGVMYNGMSDTVDEYVRFGQSEKDPYSQIRLIVSFARANRRPDFQLHGPQDEASLETLQSAFFSFKDPEFPNRGKTRSVLIPATGKKLKFTYWLQPKPAPIVYVLPGLGSHRLSPSELALAELADQNGFSAVTISSAYNYEFMEHASTSDMPAYAPVDAHDVHVALTEIDRKLDKEYPKRLGGRALMGYSMGAFHSLIISATPQAGDASLVHFERFVAINPPVRLLYGVSQLDSLYEAPMSWPAAERSQRLDNTLLKLAALPRTAPVDNTPPPFEGVESKFLIGLTFRLILRDLIYSSESRHNHGVLKQPIRNLRREALYSEILQYSYAEYFEKFLIPYYKTRGVDLSGEEMRAKGNDLRAYASQLQADSRLRLFVNRNDMLLAPEDLSWLQSTLDARRLKVFDKGGHLGNLIVPAVQQEIMKALSGLSPAGNKQ